MEEHILGLTAEEVLERRNQEHGSGRRTLVTKTKRQIFKENIVTLFNLLNVIIVGMLFAVGAYSNMLFFAIIILNVVIGIAQELKAKKMIDALSILNRPQIAVVRDGAELMVEQEEVVTDDTMILEGARQICNDAVVASGMIEVNESLLTGESDSVIKKAGDELFSGSSVISGRCYATVTHVGSDNYAAKLAEEVKRDKKVESELLGSMKKVTRFTSFLIVPLGVLLFLEAMLLRDAAPNEAVVSSAAALLGMLPKGLLLLISVSLATGTIRLAQKRILVQNIYALETLAHVDILCLDKTGTITDGNMKVQEVELLQEPSTDQAVHLLKSYLAHSEDNNATIRALRDEISPQSFYEPACKISFSSARKWGAVSFENAGTIFVGAPERILKQQSEEADQWMERGYRVIAAGYAEEVWTDEKALPETITPLYLIALEDTIRKHTRQTLSYFKKEGTEVKIISGDHVKTVAMIAKQAGLERWEAAVDLSVQGEDADYDTLSRSYSVFARSTPKQKQLLVQAMKRQGHHVAMTGDGVNDLLALREADCSIAISEGSDASRQISQIVLLDSDFTYLPQVVQEGRRVIHNVTRTAGVFFIKTIYSILITLFCLLLNVPFPFIPIQITLLDAFVEAWPSFATIFESNTKKLNGRFLKTALRTAFPYALTITIALIAVGLTVPYAQEQKQTILYVLLLLISMSAVIKSCIPFTVLRSFVCVTMVLGSFAALYMLPSLFEVVPLTTGMIRYLLIAFAGSMFFLILISKFKTQET